MKVCLWIPQINHSESSYYSATGGEGRSLPACKIMCSWRISCYNQFGNFAQSEISTVKGKSESARFSLRIPRSNNGSPAGKTTRSRSENSFSCRRCTHEPKAHTSKSGIVSARIFRTKSNSEIFSSMESLIFLQCKEQLPSIF